MAGAVFITGSNYISVTNTVFYSNVASGNTSGGLYIYNNTGPSQIINSTFDSNNGNNGAGLLLDTVVNIVIEGSNFLSNIGNSQGSGAYLTNSNFVTFSHVVFQDQLASNNTLGTLYAYNSNFTLYNTTFSQNSANRGSALYLNNSNVVVSYSNFTNNLVVQGTIACVANSVFNVLYDVAIYSNQALFPNTTNFFDDGTNTGCNFSCPTTACSDCSFYKSNSSSAPTTACCNSNTCNGHGTCFLGACTCDNFFNVSTSCSACSGQYSVATNCTDCNTGYWGNSCQSMCSNCNGNGVCNGGIAGNGTCNCIPNFNTSIDCADCYFGYYGGNCSGSCIINCNGHGSCSQGINGTGSCICDTGFNPANDCGSSGSQVGLIVGIVIASIAGLALIICVPVYIMRKRRRSNEAYVKLDSD